MLDALPSASFKLTSRQVLVLDFLIRAQNADQITIISALNLSQRLGVHRHTVTLAISRLNELGLIRTCSIPRNLPSEHRILAASVPVLSQSLSLLLSRLAVAR